MIWFVLGIIVGAVIMLLIFRAGYDIGKEEGVAEYKAKMNLPIEDLGNEQ